jgi:cyclic pyranopterin phosphate synthase
MNKTFFPDLYPRMDHATALTDNFDRSHTYLRISVIDTCNFACTYCFTGRKPHKQVQSHLMQADEIETLARIFVSLGINKIRLTGGEPLLRKDITDIFQRLRKLDTQLTLSTNGYLLDAHLDDLKAANITSLNISLDTFREDRFYEITHYHGSRKVMQNIQRLITEGFDVKLNAVLMRGVNDDEISDFIAFTKDHPVHMRFIEFMPFSANSWQSEKVIRSSELLEIILRDYDVIKLEDDIHDTAKKYKIPGYAGDFGMISTVTEPFCSGCNRLRLTADGKMRNCLFAQRDTDLLTPLRNGEDVIPLIMANVKAKFFQYGGQKMTPEIKNSNMILIGG